MGDGGTTKREGTRTGRGEGRYGATSHDYARNALGRRTKHFEFRARSEDTAPSAIRATLLTNTRYYLKLLLGKKWAFILVS
jgi:hypothetical protein